MPKSEKQAAHMKRLQELRKVKALQRSDEDRAASHKEANRRWRERNRAHLRKYGREAFAKNRKAFTALRRAYYLRNRKSEIAKAVLYNATHKDRIRPKTHARLKRRYAAEPEMRFKQKARHKLSNALRDGKIIRPERCSECGRSGKIQGHHHKGYAPENALNVIWVCRPCHLAAHPSKYGALDPHTARASGQHQGL